MSRGGAWKRRVPSLLGWAAGAVFIYSGVQKIHDPALFAKQIRYYKLVPLSVVNLQAILMPWWELAAGVALLISRWRNAGALLALLMSCVFAVAVSTAIFRGLDITCGCFGAHSAKVGLPVLGLDLILITVCAVLLLPGSKKKNQSGT